MERQVLGRQRALFITASVLAGLAALLVIADGIEGYHELRKLKMQMGYSFIGVTRFLGAVFLAAVSTALIRAKTKAAMMILPLTFYFVPSILTAFQKYGRGILFGIFVPDYWAYHYQEILFSFLIPALLYAIILMTVLLVIPTRITVIVLLGFYMAAPLAYVMLHSERWYLFSNYQWSNILFLTAVLLSVIALPVKVRNHAGVN